MFQAEKGANSIPGYTGFVPNPDNDSDLLQIASNKNHIPNYAGFVPGIRAENLFGKTFGKITLLSSTRSHHQGSDLPKDLRYMSEVKEAYVDSKCSKIKDKLLYGKLDPATSKAQAYTLSNFTSTEVPKSTQIRGIQSGYKPQLIRKKEQVIQAIWMPSSRGGNESNIIYRILLKLIIHIFVFKSNSQLLLKSLIKIIQ